MASFPQVKKRVLLLEDMPILAKMNCEILVKNGYETAIARTADEILLRLANNDVPDVLILDVMVPGSMNGIELLRRLRKDAKYQRVGMIVLTGEANTSTEKEARDAGADAFFAKPYSVSAMLECVAALTSH